MMTFMEKNWICSFLRMNVYSYNEFLKSSCQLVLNIVDNIFVDIYVKNDDILKKIYDNAVNFGFMDVSYIKDISEVSPAFMKNGIKK